MSFPTTEVGESSEVTLVDLCSRRLFVGGSVQATDTVVFVDDLA